jgi:hypothetical protein
MAKLNLKDYSRKEVNYKDIIDKEDAKFQEAEKAEGIIRDKEGNGINGVNGKKGISMGNGKGHEVTTVNHIIAKLKSKKTIKALREMNGGVKNEVLKMVKVKKENPQKVARAAKRLEREEKRGEKKKTKEVKRQGRIGRVANKKLDRIQDIRLKLGKIGNLELMAEYKVEFKEVTDKLNDIVKMVDTKLGLKRIV